MADVLACLRRFRDTLTKEPLELTSPENDVVPSIERIRQALSDQKKQLQLLLNQKMSAKVRHMRIVLPLLRFLSPVREILPQ